LKRKNLLFLKKKKQKDFLPFSGPGAVRAPVRFIWQCGLCQLLLPS